jgi:hypothetical protein
VKIDGCQSLFMIVALLALGSSDTATPPVAFKSSWKFGLNLYSTLIVVALCLALMAAVYACERRYSARNGRALDGVPPVIPPQYQVPAAPFPTFAQV